MYFAREGNDGIGPLPSYCHNFTSRIKFIMDFVTLKKLFKHYRYYNYFCNWLKFCFKTTSCKHDQHDHPSAVKSIILGSLLFGALLAHGALNFFSACNTPWQTAWWLVGVKVKTQTICLNMWGREFIYTELLAALVCCPLYRRHMPAGIV